MATEIGEIKIIIGKAELIGPEGTQPLRVGDKVFSDQIISTGANSAVEVEFLDGSVLDLPRDSQVVLDNEIYDPSISESEESDTPDEIAALQQALLDGEDPTQQGESTAASSQSQSTGNEGSSTTQITLESHSITPESGFETSFSSAAVAGRTTEEEPVPPLTLEVEEQTSPQILDEPTSIPEELPVATNDEVEIGEDISVVIDVLANDTRGAGDVTLKSNTAPENGTVQLNEDGTFTYTPFANFSGEDSFTYVLTDSAGNTSIATANINVTPVADAPTLILSVGEPEIESETEVSTQLIDINNVNENGNGFKVTAFDVHGANTDISINSHPNHAGFGVTGAASGDATELGFANWTGASEGLSVQFDQAVDSVSVSFAWLNPEESAGYSFYSNNVLVGSSSLTGGSDTIDPAVTLKPTNDVSFDEIRFSAPGTGDDYLIHSIEFDVHTVVSSTYTYTLNMSAELTDIDGSESLSGITLSGLPTGTSIEDVANSDGTYNPGQVTLISDHELSHTDINEIQGEVTATDGSHSKTAQINVKVEVSDLDATGNSADLLLEGDSNDNVISGGDGSDILIGGQGNDILSGGAGEDIFVWDQNDIATPAQDVVLDFDKNNDVLNLADLLSDPALGYSIEGIDNGGSLQLNIGSADASGHIAAPVQEITLNGVSIDGSVEATLQTLLGSGAINDGL